MSLHNLWLRRLLSSSHFRDPLPTPADMLNIEWGQNFCLEPLLSLSTSNTSMRACVGSVVSSLLCTHMYACTWTHKHQHTHTHTHVETLLYSHDHSHCSDAQTRHQATVQRFGSRIKADHSFQLHFCQVTYTVLLLLGQSFSNSLIQNHLIPAHGQIGDPSPVSFTWPNPPQ